jgi:hypothetical protein
MTPVLAALLLAAFGLAGKQQDARADRAKDVELERRILLQKALLGAGDDARQAAFGALSKLARSGVPSAYSLPLDTLASVWHGLVGDAAPEAMRELQGLADSFDLRCVPGAFTAGERTPITVHVMPLYAPTLPADSFDLVLTWRGPGGECEPARREAVDPRAVRAAGFEMYIHAPSSEQGTWELVPSVVHGEECAAGIPVPVECVADLAARLARLESSHAEAALPIRRLLESGERDALSPPVAAALDGAQPNRARPLVLEGLDLAGHEIFAVGPEPSERALATLIAVAPRNERAEWLLAGPALEGWAALASSERLRVLSTDLPLSAKSGPTVCRLVEAVRASEPEQRIVLLARGPVLGELAIALRAEELSCFDMLVESSILSEGAKPSGLWPCHVLFAEVFADEARGLEELHVEHGFGAATLHLVRSLGPPLFADLSLPSHIAAWLQTSAGKAGVSGH